MDIMSSALNQLSKALQLHQTSRFYGNQHLNRVITSSHAASHHVCYTEWVITRLWCERDRGLP